MLESCMDKDGAKSGAIALPEAGRHSPDRLMIADRRSLLALRPRDRYRHPRQPRAKAA
jgi:hypothetical protein